MTNFSAIEGWAPPGVAAPVIGNHAVDAATMFLGLDDNDGINVFDAIILALNNVHKGTSALNEGLFTVVSTYSMRDKVDGLLERIVGKLLTENTPESKKILENLEKKMSDEKSEAGKFLKAHKKFAAAKKKGNFLKTYQQQFSTNTAKDAAMRKELIDLMTYIHQYSDGEGGNFKVPKVVAKEVPTIKEEVKKFTEKVKEQATADEVTFFVNNEKYEPYLNKDGTVSPKQRSKISSDFAIANMDAINALLATQVKTEVEEESLNTSEEVPVKRPKGMVDRAAETSESAAHFMSQVALASKSPFFLRLSSLLTPFLPKDLTYEVRDTPLENGNKGEYDWRNSHLVVAVDKPMTVMHEFVHAATLYMFNDPKFKPTKNQRIAMGQINTLYKLVKSKIEATPLNELPFPIANHMENIGEFMAWGLTANAFQNYLKTITVQKRSLWQQFTNKLSDLLGIPASYTDAFSGLIQSTDLLLTEETNPLGSTLNSSSNFDAKAFQSDTNTDTIEMNEDNTMRLFETLSDINGNDTVEHQTHLRKLLRSLVTKVQNKASIYQRTKGKETGGIALGGDIYLNLADATKGILPGIRLSGQEVLVHEMVHTLIANAVHTTAEAAIQIRDLYKLADKAVFSKADEDVDPQNKAGERVMSWRAFMPAGIDSTHTSFDIQKKIAQENYDYIFGDSIVTTEHRIIDKVTGEPSIQKIGNHYNEFAAHAVTNAPMMAYLAKIKENSLQVEGKTGTLFNKVMSIVNSIIDTVSKLFGNEGALTLDKRMERLVNELAGNDHRQKSIAYNAIEKFSDSTDAISAGLISAITSPIVKVLDYTIKKSKNSSVRTVAETVRHLDKFDPDVFFDTIKQIRGNTIEAEDNIRTAILTELQGDNPRDHYLYVLNRKSNQLLDQTRLATADYIAKHLLESFVSGTRLTNSIKLAITKVFLQTDMTALTADGKTPAQYNSEEIYDLITDNGYLQKQIDVRTNEILTDPLIDSTYHKWYTRMSENMGKSMATGKDKFGIDIVNPELIASAEWLTKQPTITDPVKLANASKRISTLATLYAIQNTNSNAKAEAAKIYRKELDANVNENGITFTMAVHKDSITHSREVNFLGESKLMAKGYIKENFDPGIATKVGTLEDKKEFEEEGYILRQAINKDDAHDPNKDERTFIYVNPHGRSTTLTSGIVSYTNKRSSGTGILDGRIQTKSTDPVKDTANDFPQILASKIALMDKLATNSKVTNLELTPGVNSLRPIFNPQGEIVDFNYNMSEESKIELLGKHDAFDDVLGSMEASIVDKVNTNTVNNTLIEASYEDFKKNHKKYPHKWIPIGPRVASERYRNIWQMMPYEAKAHIKKVWGSDTMYVPAHMGVLIFGQHKATVANLSKKHDPALSQLHNFVNHTAATVLNRTSVKYAESILIETVSAAKDAIVVKTGTVLFGNASSNSYMLKIMGVPTLTVFKGQYDGVKYAKKWLTDSARLDYLIREERLVPSKKGDKAILNEIVKLESELQTNPLKDLIDEGVFQTLNEDLNNEHDTFSFKGKLERKLQENRYVNAIAEGTPEFAKTLMKEGLMLHGSDLYNFMREATQLSDLAARYTLHTHNLSQGMSHEKSVNLAMRAFIEYDTPTHKAIQYANDTGLFMFSKFFMRIQRVLVYMAVHHPSQLVTSMGLMFGLGIGPETPWTQIPTPEKFFSKFNFDPIELFLQIFKAPATGNVAGGLLAG